MTDQIAARVPRPNGPEQLAARVREGRIRWGWPLLMAFVRLPLIALGVVAAYAFFALRGYAEPFLLSLTIPPALMLGVNLVSLALLARLTRREVMRLRDLIGFDRSRLGCDIALGLLWLVVLNVPFMAVVVLGTVALTRPSSGAEFAAGFEQVFAGRAAEAYSAVEFPLWWAVLVAVSFSLLNPVVEEMHYRGYVQPRLTALSGSARIGIGVMALGFAVQHLTYAYSVQGALVYFLAFLVWGTGAGLIYRRQRRLPSLVVTHFVINASGGALPVVLARTSTTT